MEFYALLSSLTFIIILLAVPLWTETRNISFPLGIAILYYWSLYGAWFLISDKLSGSSGHYAYLEVKMFALNLDDNYFKTLVYYGLFIIVIEITLLSVVRPVTPGKREASPIPVSHGCILLFAAAAGLVSYLLIRPHLSDALQLGLSGYKATRDTSPYFSIHQVLNRAALIAIAIGFAALCSGDKPRLLKEERHGWTWVAYFAVIGGLYSFNFVLGDKNEPLNAGIAGCLLYCYNSRRLKIPAISAAGTLGLCGLWLIDHFRAYPLSEIRSQIARLDFSGLFGNSYGLIDATNEPFAAHFSMYGVLAYHIEIVPGKSLISLMASMVPRALWKSRPQDIYSYYVASVGATHGQGYTIHHATGWYLNFGPVGVILGAVVLALVWAGCFNSYARRSMRDSRWRRAFQALAPWLFVAFLPNMVRAGLEAYKSLVFEGLLIPVTIVALAGGYREWILWKARIHLFRSPLYPKPGSLLPSRSRGKDASSPRLA